ERELVGEPDDGGVVGGRRVDEDARVGRDRQAGDDRRQRGGRQLASAARAVGELGEPHFVEAYDRAVPDARYTAEQVDAAVAALAADPERLGHAQELVTHAAP